MSFRIAYLPDAFLSRVREQGIDDQGQPVRRFRSVNGGEPCRDVLRRARPGEEIILASFCPFNQAGPYKEFGPVFVLASPCDELIARDRLPLPTGRPEDYFSHQVVLRAYSQAEDIVDGVLISAEEAPAAAEQLLAAASVAFVHARFVAHGCFGCRIERA